MKVPFLSCTSPLNFDRTGKGQARHSAVDRTAQYAQISETQEGEGGRFQGKQISFQLSEGAAEGDETGRGIGKSYWEICGTSREPLESCDGAGELEKDEGMDQHWELANRTATSERASLDDLGATDTALLATPLPRCLD